MGEGNILSSRWVSAAPRLSGPRPKGRKEGGGLVHVLHGGNDLDDDGGNDVYDVG